MRSMRAALKAAHITLHETRIRVDNRCFFLTGWRMAVLPFAEAAF